ncbi:MAG: hypothetical protein E7191_01880 [Erysipelotrichaceae bacterium]|nr:hypothetical protein [Erysipelotrichaceae bacterium]MBR3693059.1 hypothetical protein [Erysipelotrichales bacterium]
MNHQISRYVYTLVFLCTTYCMVSIFFALLMFYSILSFDTYEMIANVLSVILWSGAGVLLGRFVYKKALLCALPVIGVYVAIVLVMFLMGNSLNMSDLYLVLARIVGFGICTRVAMRR